MQEGDGMKTQLANRPLARIPHDEIIRLLTANPRNQTLANEFMARYDAAIRQTVARAIYKRKGSASYEAIHPMIEDAVGETYCRLFQNDCQVLRSFKCRYENSVFAYLRAIACSVTSNQLRTYQRQRAFGSSQTFNALKEKYEDGLSDDGAAIPRADSEACQQVERKSIEEMLRANFRLAFRNANVNRNFIIFKLHFLYGYHSREIAHIKGLGLSARSVGNTADRMRKCLQKGNGESRKN
jgi:DNA-directed RNA polymerase specialized sigma24 family protein